MVKGLEPLIQKSCERSMLIVALLLTVALLLCPSPGPHIPACVPALDLIPAPNLALTLALNPDRPGLVLVNQLQLPNPTPTPPALIPTFLPTPT